MMFPIYAIPVLSLALVAWAVASRRLSNGPRRASMVAAILLACGVFTLLRTGGITGDADSDFHWRWTQTPEERLLAQAGDEPAALPAVRSGSRGDARATSAVPASGEPAPAPATAPAAAETPDEAVPAPASDEPTRYGSGDEPAPAAQRTGADWPGFRGPERDGIVRGVRIETDWSAVAAGRAVAPADRTGLVVLRGPRRSPLHPGAARRRRGRLLLQPDHRRAGVETPRRGPVLGVECRRRSARDADPQQRSRLHVRCDRNPERARRRQRRRSSGRATRRPTPARRSRAGASRARRWWSATSSSSPPPARSPPTTSPPASRAGSARPAAGATARRIWRRSTASRRSCC